MHNRLIELAIDLVGVDKFDIQLVRELFKPVAVRRGEVLHEAGRVCSSLYFINSGFVRVFFVQDGDEVTNHLTGVGGFITAFNSFITQTRSHESMQCLTDGELLRIEKANFEALLQHSQKWAEFGRKLYETSLACKEQRTNDFITLSAEERYLKLLREQPSIVQQVPVQYIASFLGMKPESLSRIRRKVTVDFLTKVK